MRFYLFLIFAVSNALWALPTSSPLPKTYVQKPIVEEAPSEAHREVVQESEPFLGKNLQIGGGLSWADFGIPQQSQMTFGIRYLFKYQETEVPLSLFFQGNDSLLLQAQRSYLCTRFSSNWESCLDGLINFNVLYSLGLMNISYFSGFGAGAELKSIIALSPTLKIGLTLSSSAYYLQALRFRGVGVFFVQLFL